MGDLTFRYVTTYHQHRGVEPMDVSKIQKPHENAGIVNVVAMPGLNLLIVWAITEDNRK